MPRSTRNSNVEEAKHSFNKVEHGSKNFKVQDDIARLERAVNALQNQVSQLSDERQLFKDNHDKLKRDNQRRMWEITKLQDENRDIKEKCDQIQQMNLALKAKSTEFRVAINKLRANSQEVKEKCDQIQLEFRVAINKLEGTIMIHKCIIRRLLGKLRSKSKQ